MPTSRVNLAALAVALIAGLVVLHDTQDLITSLSGLTLLVALLAYGRDAARTASQSFAFALVCGLAALCVFSYPLGKVLSSLSVSPTALAQYFPPMFWLLATGIFFFTDRPGTESVQPVHFGGYTQPVAPTPQAAPPPQYETRPVFTPAPLISTPMSTPMSTPPPAPPTVETQLPPPPVMAAAPVPAAHSGKEVSIYVTMLGEGMNVLRTVRAEHLGRDFYIITEQMPADENWEYTTGQVVRCKKKNLSNGKGLVAFEEAPRAQQA
jgi:hypothetical protein